MDKFYRVTYKISLFQPTEEEIRIRTDYNTDEANDFMARYENQERDCNCYEHNVIAENDEDAILQAIHYLAKNVDYSYIDSFEIDYNKQTISFYDESGELINMACDFKAFEI